jgi:hypothetical protein
VDDEPWTDPPAGEAPRGLPESSAKSLSAPGYTLFRSHVGAKFPVPSAAGSTLWAVEGWYLYALTLPRDVDTDFVLGHTPVNKLGGSQDMVAAAQFLNGLMANQKPPPSLTQGISF